MKSYTVVLNFLSGTSVETTPIIAKNAKEALKQVEEHFLKLKYSVVTENVKST